MGKHERQRGFYRRVAKHSTWLLWLQQGGPHWLYVRYCRRVVFYAGLYRSYQRAGVQQDHYMRILCHDYHADVQHDLRRYIISMEKLAKEAGL